MNRLVAEARQQRLDPQIFTVLWRIGFLQGAQIRSGRDTDAVVIPCPHIESDIFLIFQQFVQHMALSSRARTVKFI